MCRSRQAGPVPQKLLVLENVSRSFTVSGGLFARRQNLLAVDGVSLFIRRGECLGLVGESGCGKSTLGRLACGLLAPSSGRVLLEGRVLPPASAASWAAGRIQMIFQDPASSLNPRLSVLSSVAEPLLAAGAGREERRARAEELLRMVGLEGAGRRYPHEFSGGQRQRIAIARALATRPSLLVCDEPVSALDVSVQAQVLNLLRDVQERLGLASLFISHDLCVIGFMCRYVVVMYLGQAVEFAPREALFSRPAHPYSRALLAAMPRGEADWRKKAQSLPPPLRGELPSPLAPPPGCRFHPRCPEAREICAKEPPPWRELDAGWRARCHFATA